MKEIVEFKQEFKPKGKVTVQLFDENGKMINEQKSENFIAKPIQKYFDQLMRDVFTSNRATGGHNFYNIYFDPFHSLELTDATHPEDSQNEWVRAGNVIGYALTTGSYSGDNILRGSYNLIESFTNREQVHIVVDFPTHAGNGTFQSIYFMGGRNSLGYYHLSKLNGNAYYKIVKHNGVVYAFSSVGSNSALRILDEKTYERIDSIPLGRNYFDFCIVGNKIYFITNRELYSANISNPSEATIEKDGFASSIYGVNYNPTTGRWFISTSSGIDMYDIGWNLLSNYTGLNYHNSSYNKIIAVTEEGIITSYGDFIHMGGAYDGQIVRLANISSSSSSNQPRLAGVVDGYLIYYTNELRNDGLYRIPLINIGSRTLLDQPVIKTANNTMKVIYDFMLPPEL